MLRARLRAQDRGYAGLDCIRSDIYSQPREGIRSGYFQEASGILGIEMVTRVLIKLAEDHSHPV